MPEAVLQPAPVRAKTRRYRAIHSCSRSSCGMDEAIADHRTAAFSRPWRDVQRERGATSPPARSRRLACVLDRKPPEDWPPDDVVEQADPAEAPGQHAGRRAVDESHGAE